MKKNIRKHTKMIKLANKLAGFNHFSQGELEVAKTYAAAMRYTKLDSKKEKKTCDGYQKKINYKRQMK